MDGSRAGAGRWVDVLVVGGGIGGVAAALAAADAGATVVLTEATDWIGGQFTSQAVPPDDHPWIEQFGSTARYRDFRRAVRQYYRDWYPLRAAARAERYLNPGLATVSRLSHEPRVALAVLNAMLAPYLASGAIELLLEHRPIAVDVDGDTITGVTLVGPSGDAATVDATFVLDATETGDLLPLASVEYVVGAESVEQTGEPHAAKVADPQRTQGFTVCFAMDYLPTEDHVIDRPAMYDFWRDPQAPVRAAPQIGWPNPTPTSGCLRPNPTEGDPVVISTSYEGRFAAPPGWNPVEDLWRFRRLLARKQLDPEPVSDITLVNWSANDYGAGTILDVPEPLAEQRIEEARQLSLSLLYWLQTEAPRPDGGTGFAGLRPRPDVTGASHGMAKAPYIRESRRIVARTTVVEQDISVEVRGEHGARTFDDSVGIGSYRIDLHPSASGGERFNAACCPFQVPLGALLPVRVENLIAAAKNIGTTHITNGCYRVHPVEWGIGEAAGALAAFCVRERVRPVEVHESPGQLAHFQAALRRQGAELTWPHIVGY
jgi:hypothetical protein